jgi:hypothetical protein
MSMPRPEGWDLDEAGMSDLKIWLRGRMAWLLLIAYALLLVKPALPVVADTFAHTFWKEKHMLTVHEVNGIFHMHNEMSRAEKQEKEKHVTANSMDTYDCIVIGVPEMTLRPLALADIVDYNLFLCGIITTARFFDYPPPQFLLYTAGTMCPA